VWKNLNARTPRNCCPQPKAKKVFSLAWERSHFLVTPVGSAAVLFVDQFQAL